MKKLTHLFAPFALITLMIFACKEEAPLITINAPILPGELLNYAEPEDAGFIGIDPRKFDVSDAGATLGRVLFYDKILSKNNKVSCGSCHLQEHAFAQPVAFSTGINGQVLTRNTPALTNNYDDPFLFWDGRAGSLNDLALKPIRNHREMGLDDMDFLVAKVKRAPYYAPLFEEAFGSGGITQERVSDALAQFVSSMYSGNSKYDRFMAGDEEFMPLEQEGFQLFFGNARCYNCHSGMDFNTRGGGFGGDIIFGGWGAPRANIGLDKNYADDGFGMFDKDMRGEFKIPTLRNIALTAPYMHDGRFAKLDDVINHYNKNIADHENLADELKDWETGGPVRLGLSEPETAALRSFLMTLTDEAFVQESKFSDPFR